MPLGTQKQEESQINQFYCNQSSPKTSVKLLFVSLAKNKTELVHLLATKTSFKTQVIRLKKYHSETSMSLRLHGVKTKNIIKKR